MKRQEQLLGNDITAPTQNAVVVKDLYKTFTLPHEQHSGIKQALINIFNRKSGYETQKVLTDISFEIKKGEFFGIVGRNGSGKSTLLKLLAGIYVPDKGLVQVNGSLTPFIELGVGFNPELTGRENVFLNGALLGFDRKQMEKMYDDIVEFAEIEKFMDQKLKNYSSGMQVRLAFSIAIRSNSDILLFDEVLAVGDTAFQQKCYEVFSDMHNDSRTIILVTHDMSAVQRFCQRAVMISEGKIQKIATPGEIADLYLEQNYEQSIKEDKGAVKSSNYKITNLKLSSFGDIKTSFNVKEPIKINFTLASEKKMPVHIGLQIYNGEGAYCFGTNTKINNCRPIKARTSKIELDIIQNFVPGVYFITIAVMNENAASVLHYLPKVATFNIKQGSLIQGVGLLEHKWSIKDV